VRTLVSKSMSDNLAGRPLRIRSLFTISTQPFLHLLGIDHERLTFYHNGIQRRLTNVHGNVLTGRLA
jgi:hypothetical protein